MSYSITKNSYCETNVEPLALLYLATSIHQLRTVLSSRYLLLICAFTAIGKFAATFVYNNFQHALRAEGLGVEERTELSSAMNFYSQSGTLAFQAVPAAALMRVAGVGVTLAAACSVIVGLFAWLAVDAGLWPLMVAKVVQEIVGYGLLVPAQHVLFTVVSRAEKYESKAFVDTVVFRGSDVVAANVCDALERLRSRGGAGARAARRGVDGTRGMVGPGAGRAIPICRPQ
jgi:AAA family ATP:ADP antiporter